MKFLIAGPLIIVFWVCLFLVMAEIAKVLRLHYHVVDLQCPDNKKKHGKARYGFCKAYHYITLIRDFFTLGFRLFREKHK